MTAAIAAPRSRSTGSRPDCVACARPYGRRRAPLVVGDGLLGCDDLMVCDQCWHLAGGAAAVRSRLSPGRERGGRLEPLLVFDPAVDALFSGTGEYDSLHPSDRLLVESGVRWVVLRHIAVPARVELARRVLDRAAPPGTRAADSPEEWIEAVEARIREQAGTEFKYTAKRRRWWRISSVFRHCADRDRRPLTWVTQEEIAAAVGCSTRTVRRCVAWLQQQGLLFEVVPGCQLPQQAAPDDETTAERERRHLRELDAVRAEEAAIARARAELDAVRAGDRDDPPDDAPDVVTAQQALPLDVPVSAEADGTPEERPLVRLAPVYELRLSVDPAEAIPVTSVDAVGSGHVDEIGHPPLVSYPDQLKSSDVHPVDNRRAPRGPDQRVCPPHQSEAVRAAHWLLHSRLDPRICDGVSLRWLAAQIRGSHLLDRHEWTWDDLADQLHGYPEYTHLPRYVRDCRAWIRARITRATPTLSPTKLRIIHHIERRSPALRRSRQAEAEHARRADIARRRAAIGACDLCDEQGWLHVPADTPTARCNHDPSTGGW
ncbi:hypothetical protein [Pseudonocardia acaciae]|uniref:hypothetical protein n=1 Tax=Pseudonocardia acaciae TaxID=551276 RepID=UPI00048E0C7E|nr:hypothetical protein [Pseudonocardia acaciae]